MGEVASRFCPVPLPGSVLGLLLLFFWLNVLGTVPANLGILADRMLELFGLFFVPAGVGVMIYKTLIARDFMPDPPRRLGRNPGDGVRHRLDSEPFGRSRRRGPVQMTQTFKAVVDVASSPAIVTALTVAVFVGAQNAQRRWPNVPLFNRR